MSNDDTAAAQPGADDDAGGLVETLTARLEWIAENINTLAIKRTNRDSNADSTGNAWKQTIKDLIGPQVQKSLADVRALEARRVAAETRVAELEAHMLDESQQLAQASIEDWQKWALAGIQGTIDAQKQQAEQAEAREQALRDSLQALMTDMHALREKQLEAEKQSGKSASFQSRAGGMAVALKSVADRLEALLAASALPAAAAAGEGETD